MAQARIAHGKFIAGIMLALVVWGAVHALGAFGVYQFDFDWRKLLVVSVSFTLFLGMWLVALGWRAWRQSKRPVAKDKPAPPRKPPVGSGVEQSNIR